MSESLGAPITGFKICVHIVTGPVPFNADGPILQHWNAVYQHLIDHGFSRKPVMEGA